MRRGQNRPAPLKRTASVLCADGLALLMALLGTVFSFSSAFQLDLWALPLLVFCLLAGLLSLAIFSLPKLRHCLIALAGVLALSGYGVWRLWDALFQGEVSVRCAVVNRFAQDLTFLHRIYPLADLPSETWTAVTTLFVAAAAAGLALLLGWAVARARSFWLVFWLTFPFLAAPLCITVTPDWVPLMALVAVWCTLLLTSLAARRDPAGGARLTLIALPVTCALLLALTLALPREGYRQPRWAANAQVRLTEWGMEVGRALSVDGGLLPGPFSGFTAAGGSERIDLERAGPLHYSGRTMLRLETEVQGKIYLRGYAAGVYTGSGWNPLPETVYEEPSYQALEGVAPMNLPALTDPSSPFFPVTVEIVSAPGGCVYIPYQIVTTPEQVRGAQFYQDAYLARDRNVRRHTVYYKPINVSEENFAPLTGGDAEREQYYRTFVVEHYTKMPESVKEIMLRFLERAAEDREAGDVVYNIFVDNTLPEEFRTVEELRQYLSQILEQYTHYDPDTPLTPEGEDFLDYFLNESGRGYCMHYATAATLLFRLYDYPARYVSGYVASVPESGKVDVPDSAAHAWTEVYIDGYGWYPVDLTPGYEGGALPWAEEDETQPTPTPSASVTPTPKPSQSAAPSAAPTPTPSAGAAGLAGPGGGWAWIAAALLVLAALLVAFPLRLTLLRRHRARRFAGPDANRAVIDLYAYLQRLRRWGAVLPPEVAELAQKAKFSQHTLTEEERGRAMDQTRAEVNRMYAALPPLKRFALRWVIGSC